MAAYATFTRLVALTSVVALTACGGDDPYEASDKIIYDCTCSATATDGTNSATVQNSSTQCIDPEYADAVVDQAVSQCADDLGAEGLTGECTCECTPTDESCDE
jgi:hypothetical protein